MFNCVVELHVCIVSVCEAEPFHLCTYIYALYFLFSFGTFLCTQQGHTWDGLWKSLCNLQAKSIAGERHEGKTTRLWKGTKTDFLHCSYWHMLFLLRILTLLRNPVICKQNQLLQARMCAECKEGGVCRQPAKACHVASMHTRSSLLFVTGFATLRGNLSALNVLYVRKFFWRLVSHILK